MRHLSDLTAQQHLLSLTDKDTVRDACDAMNRAHVGSVLVTTDRQELLGIFTDHDARRVIGHEDDPSHCPLSNAMTHRPVALPASAEAIDALRMMWDCGVKHVPVVDGDRVVGVVSHHDFAPDEQTMHELERELWEHMR